jgi:hypothetical protein
MQQRIFNHLLSAVVLTLTAPLASACQLSCDVTYAGATQHIAICPTQEPYQIAAIHIGERFQFKGIHVKEGHLNPRIGIYVYLETQTSPLLLQHVVVRPPYPAAPAGASVDLLGEQHLYAGPLERELIYRCALSQDTP